MIGYLAGTARGRDIVDVGGVGYQVRVAQPLADGNDVTLHVTTVVRDDAITLYGFPTPEDQAVFGALTRVSGVGPSAALTLLAELGASGVSAAIARKDARALSAVKGIGAKTAANIVALTQLPNPVDRDDDIARALIGLGIDPARAAGAAQSARSRCREDADEQELLAAALAALRQPPAEASA